MDDFFSRYLVYAGVGTSEAPAIFHRWSCASMLGALLGRQAYFPFGHSKIFPNQYIMLMGSPGARKGSALNVAKNLLREAGYTRFASDRTSKERFLMDMRQYDDDDPLVEADLDALTLNEPSEVYVVAGEFTDFIGPNNMEFVTMLTNLWDNLPEYKNPKIHGKSVVVHEPTINIIGGNTVQGFALAFPPESLGNGFLSRMLLIYGEPTGQKIAWPKPADELIAAELANHLRAIKENIKGEFRLAPGAEELGAKIYESFVDIDDIRFKHYSTRRFIHFLKLAMILAAADLSMDITTAHMIRANTMLSQAERRMPKALGEFGKSKHSDVSNLVLDFLAHSKLPRTVNEIFKAVSKDINSLKDLQDILKNLQQVDKIQVITIKGKQGFMPFHSETKSWSEELLQHDWLTSEELA